ncbi:hypothetical protein [Brenneria corticis]|nr:hypothetical protein [Brenneria sp. CFCC 11842]
MSRHPLIFPETLRCRRYRRASADYPHHQYRRTTYRDKYRCETAL